MDGSPGCSGHDRQWELNRRNFQGRWCGSSQWFLRDGHGVLDLEQPSRVIDDTCYAIDFSDADTGVWDGSGLLFAPEGRRRLPLSRAGYNSTGQCWQFTGAGGQSSLAVDPQQSRFGHELNLFAQGSDWRSRSMLVLLWGRRDRDADTPGQGSPSWQLDAVGAVPFRCSLAAAAEPPRPQRPWQELLAEQRGWPGLLERLEPGVWPCHDPQPECCTPFNPGVFLEKLPGGGLPLVAGCVDGLVFAVPEWLPAGAFDLQVGCRLAADRFDLISITFGADQRLQAWERRRFRPAGP
ncbi:MAG: hypothetical protein VKK98_04395 [Cyanobacteriota bacterium]|nr:hypothetical protein [Cyanobacteriota bacterium]